VSLDARHEWAHDKVMIVEGTLVITGSDNWTVSADTQNSENLLVIRDPQLAGVSTENWRRHVDHSTPYQPRAPWWARVRVIWTFLTCRHPTRLGSHMGEDG
jgi:phosphatidylserine/phosphatidylglycerophosphate/cardiolipin synthase-like enzyme